MDRRQFLKALMASPAFLALKPKVKAAEEVVKCFHCNQGEIYITLKTEEAPNGAKIRYYPTMPCRRCNGSGMLPSPGKDTDDEIQWAITRFVYHDGTMHSA